MHHLLHIHEDIRRFSATDNYWYAVFERAVKGYIKRASNSKGIEKTFAFPESKREVLKPYAESKENLGKMDTNLVRTIYLQYEKFLFIKSIKMIAKICEIHHLNIACIILCYRHYLFILLSILWWPSVAVLLALKS